MKRVTLIFAMTLGLLWSVAVNAHHSVEGTFLLDQNMTLQGTITMLTIRNPHSFISIDAKDGSGRITSWSVEWVGAAQLKDEGVTEFTFKAGDQVTLVGATARDTTTRRILLRELTRPSDGFRWLGTSKDFLPPQP
jgi:DNA/RNA endonuclease YhcR with UshA esterase domain